MFDLVYPSEPAPLYPRPSVSGTLRPARPKGEIFPLVETSGLVFGQAARSWCHSSAGLLHPVVHLHILDRYSRIYLQKHGSGKENHPGLWDFAVCGHVEYGELALETLYREAAEQLNLRAFTPVLLENYVNEGRSDKEFVFAYAMVGHPELHSYGREVSQGRWWPLEELDQALGKGGFTPTFEAEFASIRTKLFSLL